MEDRVFLESDLSPSIKRTWSWRHREGATVGAGEEDTDIALELLSLEEQQNENSTGLSSQEGYRRLFEVIREELSMFSDASMLAGWRKDFWTTLHSNHHSSVSWISILFFVFEVFALVFTYGSLSTQRSSNLPTEAFIVLLIAVVNVILCVREENLRRSEIYKSTKHILDGCGDYCTWNPPDYVDPCIPSSPSISLVNTYRDGELISIPCNLLVHGDVIVLGPSQSTPANVQLLDTTSEGILNEEPLILEKGEMYLPEEQMPGTKAYSDDQPQTTLPCNTLPRRLFVVRETPFKSTLNCLLKSSSNKPVSLLENEKHFIASTVIEKRFLWVILLLLLSNSGGHWSEMVFLLQAYAILPLLPLSFPLLWISVNLYGASRIKILFEKLREATMTNVKVQKDFPVRDVLPQFWKTFAGDSSYLPRTANLLQVLGNVTVWCCIDRDGILSLPNPSVEKVFFLQSKKSTRQLHNNRFRDRKISSCTWESDVSRQTSREESNVDEASSSSSSDDDDDVLSEDGTHLKGRAAVLNISTDPESQFGLRFDDKTWQEYLNSLKPLGLNILLNSPCSCPVRAMRFSDHTAFLSLNRNRMPVHTTQRCLCLLGKEIGFTENALNLFTKQQHIFMVHPLEFPMADCPLQSSSYLAVCKERPVPCMAALVVKDYHTDSHQLLSQGSPDLVLNACSDFWDGSSLNIITAHDKKKVLDFYQRNSISSQCVAFAYRPCTEVSPSHSDVFLKLPSVYEWKSSDSVAESISEMSDEVKGEDTFMFSPKNSSVDDLKVEQLLEQVETIDDAASYHKLLGNQVFIGMVTLHYQAKKDIIPLVENLDTAGIRFVHFSSEDELKSRVFAERMGLETGWNCHISLAETESPRGRTKTAESSSNPPVAGDGEDVHDILHDDTEKHVSWIDIKLGSNEKVGRAETSGISETDDQHNKTETSALLGEEHKNTANDDYWFFYNRAKLPRGVDNIRPHLENVDNVPLLVPLFTDCSPCAVQEMITIMQEHGEVVCCVGSSFNVNNTSIFTQADLSVAVEPMFPQMCLKGLPKDFRSGTPLLQSGEKNGEKLKFDLSAEIQSSSSDTDDELSPLQLSALLNSLPCTLSFHRDNDFKFKSLLKEARRLSFGLRKCFTFILTCQLMLTVVMFLCQCLLLPPPLTGLHLLWLSCITVPLLSLCLVGSKSSKGLMSMMTGRNDRTFADIAYPFCIYFCCGFLPTCVFICAILFPLTLLGFCKNKHVTCHYLLGHRDSNQTWNGYGGSNIQVLSLAQDINAFTLALFFVFVSTSFVHHLKTLWNRSPFTNTHWLYCVIIVLGLQLLYFVISQSIWVSSYGARYTIRDVPSFVIILVFIWPLGSLFITELLKRRYIKLYIRFQKRAKLKFGTKLGMNSPF